MSATHPRRAAYCSCERSGPIGGGRAPSARSRPGGPRLPQRDARPRRLRRGWRTAPRGPWPASAPGPLASRSGTSGRRLPDRRHRRLGVGLQLLIRRSKSGRRTAAAPPAGGTACSPGCRCRRGYRPRARSVALLGGHVVERAQELAGRGDLLLPRRARARAAPGPGRAPSPARRG